MGCDGVGFEGGEAGPFFDDDNFVGADWGLVGEVSLSIDSRAIFDAAVFGADAGNDFAEFVEEGVLGSGCKFDGGDDVDHDSLFSEGMGGGDWGMIVWRVVVREGSARPRMNLRVDSGAVWS